MHLKVPPPIILLLAMIGMYFLSVYWPLRYFSFQGQLWLALILCCLGTLLPVAGFVSFQKARTTVNPHQPESSSHLVTSGVYRLSRNPMYLGFSLILLAAFVYFGSLSSLLMFPAFIAYINYFQIKPEEAILEGLFAEEYLQYCQQVRRWC
ncbi:isoprenylcysteine carboxylmethyltransferase family protein [Vibrio sp. Of7-15]|uniref:methyltransferase family protein n=1 Tax=Vibrio sp. Of7-15 TaxID=2724879 RepID=UPI001EF38002|nr:isoprenylcysteine carboxylmethyltransferase family protein [Vibrio sp. Of7-15]MCG7499101.1 isoprenylcysteine carboxylmethyltransferase family protein [Vibrio sp. Of7-15]